MYSTLMYRWYKPGYTMVCPPVLKIIHSLKLADYLHVQADKPWYQGKYMPTTKGLSYRLIRHSCNDNSLYLFRGEQISFQGNLITHRQMAMPSRLCANKGYKNYIYNDYTGQHRLKCTLLVQVPGNQPPEYSEPAFKASPFALYNEM